MGPGATDQSPGRGAGPGHRIQEVAGCWLLGNLPPELKAAESLSSPGLSFGLRKSGSWELYSNIILERQAPGNCMVFTLSGQVKNHSPRWGEGTVVWTKERSPTREETESGHEAIGRLSGPHPGTHSRLSGDVIQHQASTSQPSPAKSQPLVVGWDSYENQRIIFKTALTYLTEPRLWGVSGVFPYA